MHQIKKLCIISNYYPSKEDPYFTFVGTLIDTICDSGIECHVITPVSYIEREHVGHTRIEISKKGNKIYVYCPKFITFPDRKIASFRSYRMTIASQRRAIYRIYKKYVKDCDAIYSHFLDSGINAEWLGRKIHKPAFVACGECSISYSAPAYETYGKEIHNGFSGVIYVSSALKREVDGLNLISKTTPTIVLPNSIDISSFMPMDKKICRMKMNIPENDFVVSFVGGFIERKGFQILQNVLKKHDEWKCILIGSGEIPVCLESEQVMYTGRVTHDEIPQYICASDVFVLPTLAEGCCNAIVEAMGCGLPVISSDLEFNDDILDGSCSIRVNPKSEEQIEAAIMQLYKDKELKLKLSLGAAARGRELSIENRAKSIIEFMEKCIDEHK